MMKTAVLGINHMDWWCQCQILPNQQNLGRLGNVEAGFNRQTCFFFKAKNTYSRCWTHFGTRRTKTQVLDPLKFVWFEWWRNQRPLSTLEFFGKMESYPLVIYDKKLLTMAIVIFPINSMVIFQFVMWTFTRPGMDSNKNDMFKNRSTKRSHCEIRFQPHIGSHTFP